MPRAAAFAFLAAVGVAAPGLAAPSDLPAGAVIAFTPDTVCETLPGGWKDYAQAAGRVIVGAAPGLPAASAPAALAAYWTAGVTLKPENLPITPVTGAGQIVVTTPVASVRLNAKATASDEKPDMRLYGYQIGSPKAGESETLPVGYGAPGVVGRAQPTPAAVAPPYLALKYCVKR